MGTYINGVLSIVLEDGMPAVTFQRTDQEAPIAGKWKSIVSSDGAAFFLQANSDDTISLWFKDDGEESEYEALATNVSYSIGNDGTITAMGGEVGSYINGVLTVVMDNHPFTFQRTLESAP